MYDSKQSSAAGLALLLLLPLPRLAQMVTRTVVVVAMPPAAMTAAMPAGQRCGTAEPAAEPSGGARAAVQQGASKGHSMAGHMQQRQQTAATAGQGGWGMHIWTGAAWLWHKQQLAACKKGLRRERQLGRATQQLTASVLLHIAAPGPQLQLGPPASFWCVRLTSTAAITRRQRPACTLPRR